MALQLSIIGRQGFLIDPSPLRRRTGTGTPAFQLKLNVHPRRNPTSLCTLLLRCSINDHHRSKDSPKCLTMLPDATQSQMNGLKCAHCGDTFQRKGHLQRHLLRHTGSKSYRCSSCSKSFSRRCVVFSNAQYMPSSPCSATPYGVIGKCMTNKFLVPTTTRENSKLAHRVPSLSKDAMVFNLAHVACENAHSAIIQRNHWLPSHHLHITTPMFSTVKLRSLKSAVKTQISPVMLSISQPYHLLRWMSHHQSEWIPSHHCYRMMYQIRQKV